MPNLKAKPADLKRQQANKAIVAKLAEMVEAHPELRFQQILQDMDIIKPGEDRFYEEPEVTLSRMLDFIA